MEHRNAKDGGAQKSRRPLDITVLMGGPSTEREVSLVSGKAVADALQRLGHKVTRSDISPADASALDRRGIDLVFIVLHGDFGESGEVQTLCEDRGLRYTGSGPRASELAMDKAAAKRIFQQAGIATPEWLVVEEFQEPADVRAALDKLALPLFVKPVEGGSSVDAFLCRTPEERDEAVDALLDKYTRALVERYVQGRELTVGVLGEQVLPVLEIRPDGVFYDYRAKYSDEAATKYLFDHGIAAETVAAVQASALKAHRSLGCRDMSRVDFILDEAAGPQILEINTIPGFTSHSLLPMSAARIGLGFDGLVERLVEMAMSRPAPVGGKRCNDGARRTIRK